MRWMEEHTDFTWSRLFPLPKGGAMVHWIQNQAEQLGGEINRGAAHTLADLVDEDTRLAKMEIEKLLTYVNFSRPVTEDDVRTLTADVREGDVFAMVDAIGYGDGEKAMFMLHRLLEDSDALPLFGMIVRQFRLLIQIRELLEESPGLTPDQIAKTMRLRSSYPVKKILPQARLFTLSQLKNIFHQLSEVDHAIKTSRLDDELALDVLIATLTN
jgi:DNA polymerase-3 subunit delta